MPPAQGMGAHWPSVFHPAAFINEMDVKITEQPARGPQETVETLNLIQHFIFIRRLAHRKGRGHRTVHAIAPHEVDLANFTVLNALVQFLAATAMPDHQPHTTLQVFLVRLFGQLQHPPGGRAVGRHRFFHEYMQSFIDRIFEHRRPESQGGRQNRNVTRFQYVKRLLVGVKSQKPAILGNIHLPRRRLPLVAQAAVRFIQLVLKHVRHRH